jgi:hypothetical protein
MIQLVMMQDVVFWRAPQKGQSPIALRPFRALS